MLHDIYDHTVTEFASCHIYETSTHVELTKQSIETENRSYAYFRSER